MGILLEGDRILIRVASYTPSQVAINTLYFRVTQTEGDMTDLQLAEQFDNDIHATYKQLIASESRYRGVSAQVITVGNEQAAVTATDNDGPGDIVSDVLPKQSTGIVTFRTGRIGPRGRGRNYLPWPPEVYNEDDGRPNQDYIDAVWDYVDLFSPTMSLVFDAGISCQLRHVLWHRLDSTTSDVIQIVPRTAWATQKRRGDYGKINSRPF